MRNQINMLVRGLLILSFVTAVAPGFAQSVEPDDETPAKPLTLDERLAETKSELDSDYLLNLQKKDKTLYCLAQNAFFEARSEPIKGKVAVVEVTLNRVDSGDYPDSACGVAHQVTYVASKKVCQFSWYCTNGGSIPLKDNRGNIRPEILKQWRDSVAAAIVVYKDQINGLVKGATHFYAHHTVKPIWSHNGKFIKVGVVGNHTFLRPKDLEWVDANND